MATAGSGNFELAHQIRADPDAVSCVLLEIDAQLSRHGIALPDRSLAHILLAEALNNIVEHAYSGRGGPIDLSIMTSNAEMTFELSDEGCAMPGLTMPEGRQPRLDVALQDLPEGGWGWQILHNMARNLAYQRQGGTNRLTFQMKIDQLSKS